MREPYRNVIAEQPNDEAHIMVTKNLICEDITLECAYGFFRYHAFDGDEDECRQKCSTSGWDAGSTDNGWREPGDPCGKYWADDDHDDDHWDDDDHWEDDHHWEDKLTWGEIWEVFSEITGEVSEHFN